MSNATYTLVNMNVMLPKLSQTVTCSYTDVVTFVIIIDDSLVLYRNIDQTILNSLHAWTVES